MSRLLQGNGDDHPEAARRHLLDAGALLAQQRSDGAAYLSGYVVECSLKSVHVLETGRPLTGHNFRSLMAQVSAVATAAGARTARYLGAATRNVATSPIGAWTPEMRYRASSVTLPAAGAWHATAQAIFAETVHQMDLDGVL